MNKLIIILLFIAVSSCSTNRPFPDHYYSKSGDQIIFLPERWDERRELEKRYQIIEWYEVQDDNLIKKRTYIVSYEYTKT